MRMLLLLLMLRMSNGATTTGNIRIVPGGVVEEGGILHAVKDFISVEVDCDGLEQLPSILQEVQFIIDKADYVIRNSDMEKPQEQAVLNVLEEIRNLIVPLKVESSRKKRGLVDAVGSLAYYLFGIETVNDAESRLENYNKNLEIVRQRVFTSLEEVHQVACGLNALTNVTNTLSQELHLVGHVLEGEQRFTLMLAHVSLYFTRIQMLTQQVHTLQNDLVLAGAGEVTPSLISPSALNTLISKVTETTTFEPLFKPNNLALFYSQLSSRITPMGLSILVPLKPRVSFQIIHVHPFPYQTERGIYTLTPTNKIILKTINQQIIASISHDVLDDCSRPMEKTFVCYNFKAPERSYFQENCTRALLSNINITSQCTYDEVDSKLTLPVVLTLPDVTAIFFRQLEPITVTCNKKQIDSQIQGPLLLPSNCKLDAQSITIQPSKHFYANYTPTWQNITDTDYLKAVYQAKDTPVQIRTLPISSEDMINMIPTPHITYGYPVSMTVVGMIIIFIAFAIFRGYVYHKLMKKNDQELNTVSSPTGPDL